MNPKDESKPQEAREVINVPKLLIDNITEAVAKRLGDRLVARTLKEVSLGLLDAPLSSAEYLSRRADALDPPEKAKEADCCNTCQFSGPPGLSDPCRTCKDNEHLRPEGYRNWQPKADSPKEEIQDCNTCGHSNSGAGDKSCDGCWCWWGVSMSGKPLAGHWQPKAAPPKPARIDAARDAEGGR